MSMSHLHFGAIECAIREAAAFLLANSVEASIPCATLEALVASSSPLATPAQSSQAQASVVSTPSGVEAAHWKGLPTAAPPAVLAAVLALWSTSSVFPVPLHAHFPPFSASDASPAEAARLETLSARVAAVVAACVSEADLGYPMRRPAASGLMSDLLKVDIGATGIARCFGCRQTPGTLLGALPPSRGALVAAARQPMHSDVAGPVLSVGGRALEKHLGRLGVGWGACYWGRENEIGGSVETKNTRAERVVELILDNAVWLNVSALPGGTISVEVRVLGGYGARWHLHNGSFRGFVEPHWE